MNESTTIIKSKTEKENALDYLREDLKPGDLVYYEVTHVSNSGMSRNIRFFKIVNNRPHSLTYSIGKALGYPKAKNGYCDGLKVTGCGMDMGFAVIYNLGRALFPKGFKVKGIGRNGDMSGHDTDGGYALKYSQF